MKKVLCLFLLIIMVAQISYAQAYQKPALEKKGSFSVVMVPDFQNYSKWARNQPIMDLMMAWVADNVDTLNIKMVVGVGDLVENDEKITNDFDGDQTTIAQWKAVAGAFAKLDGKVPYIAATGNHDYSVDRQGNRSSHYSEYSTQTKII